MWLVSPATRLDANDMKATRVPSADIDGSSEVKSPGAPFGATDASWIAPVLRSFTNTSPAPLASPGTRFVANEVNATREPSAESDGSEDSSSAFPPLGRTEATT